MTIQQSSSQQIISDRRQSLETAFNLFNQLSDELSGSYRQLQLQVLALSQELAAARSERMQQLTEKESLADRLERLLETLPAAVILLDGKGRIKEFNPAARRLLSCIVLGEDWQQLLSPQLLPNQPGGNELHLRNGKVLSVSSSQLEQTPGFIQVMLDVTESRRLQERLNRQERLGAMGEMSAQLAHQMRTPLSSALLYTSHLCNDQLNREQRQDFTGKLRSRLQHMESQISDILLFARGSKVADEPLCLAELVLEFAETITTDLQRSDASLEVTMPTHSKMEILGRKDALLGVLSNLTDNALQHAATRIRITLTAGEQIHFQFADNGLGIPAEIRDEIFKPFFTTRSSGTGLGLAIAQNLMLSHQGEIQLAESDGEGTVFDLYFPLASGQGQPTLPPASFFLRMQIFSQSIEESGMNLATVLIVEDDPALREALSDTLTLVGYPVRTAGDGREALEILEQETVGVVVSDVQMRPMDGHSLLRRIKQSHADLPVLLMTAYGSIEKAVMAIHDGAVDYLVKPFEAEVLINKVAGSILPRESDQICGPVAEDLRSREVLELARRVAKSDATVMLNGESGTGKEVFARYIHRNSARHDGPFIAINCAAIPENMLEAVLFGYEKGAFTGAYQAAPGKFEQAQGGTLLLDEISEMCLPLQAKLLRVLQEKELERLGGRKLIELDVRVLATTNRTLREEVAAGRFREDLFYRLNVFPLTLPPLRERQRDILPLARHLLQQNLKSGQALPHFSDEAKQKLLSHRWSGNVRELDNLIQRALIMNDGDEIGVEALCFEDQPMVEASAGNETNSLRQSAGRLPQGLRSVEEQMILDVLNEGRSSRKNVAERLGISERTLRYKLARMREAGMAIPG